MNKYDDIKRFIEKSKTEDLDYKEINEKSMGNGITSSMNKWTLIKQISSGDEPQSALDNGRTTQPTPQPMASEEFKDAAIAAQKSAVSNPAPAEDIETKTVASDIVSPSIVHAEMNILETLRAALPEPEAAPKSVAPTVPVTPTSPAAAVASQVAPSQPVKPRPVKPEEESSAFRQMFKQKAPQTEENTLPRDTPLQPLLEMIASCR